MIYKTDRKMKSNKISVNWIVNPKTGRKMKLGGKTHIL